jgi:invasion protein IalB
MGMFHKAGVALLAIVGLTVAVDAMAACDTQQQTAWTTGGRQFWTLRCQNTN